MRKDFKCPLQRHATSLLFSQLGIKTRAESGISENSRRAPATIGGFLMLVKWQSLLLLILWGLLSGSLRACRFLECGYSTPESDPRPSSGIDGGIKNLIQGG